MSLVIKGSPAVAVIGVVDLTPRGGSLDDPDLRTHSSVSHGHRHLCRRGHEPDRVQRYSERRLVAKYGNPVIANFWHRSGGMAQPCHRFLNTVWICALSGALSLLLAVFVSMLLVSRRHGVRRSTQGVVDVLRAIPFLMLLFIVYYCLPTLHVRLSSWTCGLSALIVYNTAYFAEILRGAWSTCLTSRRRRAGPTGTRDSVSTGGSSFRRSSSRPVLSSATR